MAVLKIKSLKMRQFKNSCCIFAQVVFSLNHLNELVVFLRLSCNDMIRVGSDAHPKLRDRAEVARVAHNHEVAGSSPAPATRPWYGFG